MEFNEMMEAKLVRVEEYLRNVMKSVRDDLKVREAMEYSLFAGGKRIRPILAMSVCEMLGGDDMKMMPFACAIELIHTYSLIHDDLPCMDNDDMRRGKQSCHVKFGEAIALLAGDALQSLAFEVMAQAEEEPKIILECIRTISVATGISGMVGGQELDLFGARETAEHLQKINLLKTGALIAAACWIGAIVAGADLVEYKKIGGYAKNIGLAFQVKDDILDVTGTREEVGKTVGSDATRNKQTFA
ncbi:MAG: polyprenyl synthetase family protein, partial [Clostridiales bacterium]|nr:polyprenyl synthetase family protein [Clostridiales bacterium]